MFLLVAVGTHDLTHLFLVPPLFAFDFGHLDPGGRGGEILGFLGASLVLILLLILVFSGLMGRLRLLNGSRRGAHSPGFVTAMIFHYSLGLDFVHGGVSKSTSLEDLYIGLSYIRTRS